ncbi:aldose 1-epimerase [Paenibacillus senegalensis]|uniref:aldose 1-epimerase n=1 Tax=Paenibacillus senegalensis TaxID=1465766 RepID=UPI000288031B|nr:aldose 1-epimerase [Paenibacillus senegalensis]
MITKQQWHGVDIYVLENEQLSFSLCPSIGNNGYRLFDKAAQREVLRVPDNPSVLAASPVHYGTPVLTPPNRIKNGYFKVGEQEYRLERNEKNNTGNHIHGFSVGRPWKVTGASKGEDKLTITSEFSTADFPELLEQYPHEILMEMTYELSGSALLQKVVVRNDSSKPAPFGFGLHTWFLLDHQPEKWQLQLPVSASWELGSDLTPTGNLLPLGDLAELTNGINLQNRNLDDVFQIGEYTPLAVLRRDNYEIRYVPSAEFKQWVIYTKGVTEDVICLEPYTWVTNAPNLSLDADTTGFRTIDPGKKLELEVLLEIRHS